MISRAAPFRGALLDRFAELVDTDVGDGDRIDLGSACLLVASVLGHPMPVDEGVRRLAGLASEVRGEDLGAVAAHLFGPAGLAGDRHDYYDPANSLLPEVLVRRRGIPITLAVVAIDVARRLGIDAVGVGMPGHFLVADVARPDRWLDGFAGGAWLDAGGAEAAFDAVHGGGLAFDAQFLAATPDRAVVARVLANLIGIYRSRGEVNQLMRVVELRTRLRGQVDVRSRFEEAEALVGVGRFGDAADRYQDLQDQIGPSPARAAGARSATLRARYN